MASHALKQVRPLISARNSNLTFYAGNYPRHRATSTNQCFTLDAQPQQTPRAFHIQYLRAVKSSLNAQSTRDYRPARLEDFGTRPRNERYPRNSFARAGPPRHWCHTSCVCFPSLQWFAVSQSTAGSFTHLDHLFPMSLPSTSSHRPSRISGGSRKTSRRVSMSPSISTFQNLFHEHFWKSSQRRSQRMERMSS